MRIVIDLQGAQTESRFRGIGRYTIAFVQAIIRNCGKHEIILALSSLFPDTIQPVRSAFKGLLPQENIRVWFSPGPVSERDPENQHRREVAELLREAFLESLQPDLIHICSLFEGYVDDAVTSIGRFDSQTPISVTLFDLIPLLNPDQYLKPSPLYLAYYHRKIEWLHKASCFLTISEFTKQEGLQHLAANDEYFFNVSTACEHHFQPLSLSEQDSLRLCLKYGIDRPFILYTGGSDHRKNLPRLIQAYSALPKEIRRSHQLLFAGRMPQGDINEFKQQAKSAGLMPEELCFTGYVSDEVLVQLYNLCKIHVFPSWHEGFGLPALEAMACGAPVIGANTSSLPEVIGCNDALFDPLSVPAIAKKLEQTLLDEAFRDRLRLHGLQQSKTFSWDKTAKRALSAWEQIGRAEALHHKPTISLWADIIANQERSYDRLISLVSGLLARSHKCTDLDLRCLADCLDRNEKQADAVIRTHVLPSHIRWRVEGPFDSSYSLSLVNRETARALHELGHAVVLHSTEGPGDFQPNEQFLCRNPDLAEMYRNSTSMSQASSDVVCRNLYPPRVEDMKSRLNLMHSYAWEETGMPASWVESFNSMLQGITVVSDHVRNILINNGVVVPVVVTGNGVDHWQRIAPSSKFQINARKFRFLHVSSCFPRKGADVMLRSFGQVFSSYDDVTLVIKTFRNPHNHIHLLLDKERRANPNYPDVLLLEDDLSDEELKSLYEQCDALVAPSRCEGFGLPMAEAILSGLPVITTGWSGQLDFCTPETSWLVDFSFARSDTHFKIFGSVWAEPDTDHLAKLMAELYRATEAEKLVRVSAGQKLLIERFCWKHSADKLVSAARSFSCIRDSVEPSIAWITTWNTKCGIAAYSANLIHSMPSPVAVFAARSHQLIHQDHANVKRSWELGDSDTLLELEESICESKVNTIIFQFNYGFFDLSNLSNFLIRQADLGRVVIGILHSTTDPVHAPHKRLIDLVPGMRQCHRLLVHTPQDMNNLKALGLVNNVALFPHGIQEFAPVTEAITRSGPPFIIASFGYLLPHKGLLELVDAIGMLRGQGELVELRMYNAEYPASESRSMIDEVKTAISSMGLDDSVHLHTGYLSDQECLCRLAEANLIVYPYQDTSESSSAAVRQGIASGRPVAVTHLSIFDDVKGAVYYLPGQRACDIAAGIRDIRRLIDSADPLATELSVQAEEWRKQHYFSLLGPRLYNISQAMLDTLMRDVGQALPS